VTVTADKIDRQTIKPISSPAEFQDLFHEHWSRVYAVIFRIVGDAAEAEDLALETFLRLHQHPPREGLNLTGWLYRVGTNLALNQLRSRKRREQYEMEAGRITLESSQAKNPARQVEQNEERLKVRQVLSTMKKQSAKILVLRHSDFSYGEIAAVTGLSPNSIGKLLARAEQEFEQRYLAMEGN
jgi:RNA polymerase sigma factor (sigma-70 family)